MFKNNLPSILSVLVAAGVPFTGSLNSADAQCEVAELHASDGAAGDLFGTSVEISDSLPLRVIIGAPRDDDNGRNSGSAYVFRYDGQEWVQESKLVATDDAQRDDEFGQHVAISDGWAVIGAPYDEENGIEAGAAYVFRYDGSAWLQEAKLLPAGVGAYDSFGCSVAIAGDIIVVGSKDDDYSRGCAYVFRYYGTGWVQEQKLRAQGGDASDYFGCATAICGDSLNRIAIGASHADAMGRFSGAAYVFEFDGTSWVQKAKLVPPDGATSDWFGQSLAISDNIIVGGARGDDVNGEGSGSVYVWRYSGTNWTVQQKLRASDGVAGANFGKALDISGDTLIVHGGGTYVFRRDGTAWSEELKLVASDLSYKYQIRESVAVSENTVVVGTRHDDDNGSNAGSAHVHDLTGYCVGDLNCDMLINGFDIDAFMLVLLGSVPYDTYYAMHPHCDHLLADLNDDGIVDGFDIDPFVVLMLN